MPIVSRGFSRRRRPTAEKLPPGQYLVQDFPVLSAGPTPLDGLSGWEFRITTEYGQVHSWDWDAFVALHAEEITTAI